MNQSASFLTLADRRLAYQQRSASPENGGKPGFVFLSGLASDMSGTKATFLEQECAQAGLAFLRFDYRGHGLSSGSFEDGCIGEWAEDARVIFDTLTQGPQILIGSSMGGWISLLLARHFPERVAGFIGLAAAPDFTQTLIEPAMTEAQRKDLLSQGYMYEDDALEGQRIPITRKLMEDGKKQLVMGEKTAITGPIHLIQGQKDKEVPWRYAFKVAESLDGPTIDLTFIKDGDHRLSRPQDLDLVWSVVKTTLSRCA